jgi:shikimate kinase
MTILLCGLPMSGKTTIGKLLAKKLQLDFVDTDRLIESAYARHYHKSLSCRQIYIELGEEPFRQLEQQQLLELTHGTPRVISLGGGALCTTANIASTRTVGQILYLEMPPKALWERMKQHPLPAYLDPNMPEQSFFTLAAHRIPFYEQAADLVINTENLTVDAIVQKILSSIQR